MSKVDISLPGKVRENWFLTLLKYIHNSSPTRLRSLLVELLVYEWEKKQGDDQFLTLLKSVCNWLLVYFPLLYFLRLIQRFSSEDPWYPIEDEVILTMTRVIFTRSKRTAQHICLKLWQRSDDEVCNDKLVIRSEDYLLEGLEFNRKFAQFEGLVFNWRFAKNVYLGITPIWLSEDRKKIRRGQLIEMPERSQLEDGVKYALVMKCLNEHWRLDYQLRQNSGVIIDFLAKEVARMHKQLEKSPSDYGTPERISSKLNLNREFFLEALGQLSNGENNLDKYGWISNLMAQACEDYTELFLQRSQNSYIKRCHGDLKATNLWVRPAKILFLDLENSPLQLLALDCIDFNPEFCHIDMLSDVAMLAIDIEMNVQSWSDRDKSKEYGQGLAYYFLYRYLREMQEYSMDAWPLLRYYMTEKAIVCAYVSILYDRQPELGERYLDIAYVHAQQLGKPIESSAQALALGVS